MAERRIIDIGDSATFALIPPCADPRFDHRTCDYWEDADRGSKQSRPSWLATKAAAPAEPAPRFGLHDNPFAPGDQIAFLPAIQPDIALFHAAMADREGNVWIGRRRELVTMAHAAKTALVTVERIVDESLLANEATAAGVLPALYVGGVAEAPRGAWPLGLLDLYPADEAAIARYAAAARSDASFAAWLADFIAMKAAASGTWTAA